MQQKVLERKPRNVPESQGMPIISEYAQKIARNPEQYWREDEETKLGNEPIFKPIPQKNRPKSKPLSQPEFQVDTRSARAPTTKTGLKAIEQTGDHQFAKIDYLQEQKEKRAIYNATQEKLVEPPRERKSSIPKPPISPIRENSEPSDAFNTINDVEIYEVPKPAEVMVGNEQDIPTSCEECGRQINANDELNHVNFGGKIICSECAGKEIAKLRQIQYDLLNDRSKCQSELLNVQQTALEQNQFVTELEEREIAAASNVKPAPPQNQVLNPEPQLPLQQQPQPLDLRRVFPCVVERVICPCCGDVIETRILSDETRENEVADEQKATVAEGRPWAEAEATQNDEMPPAEPGESTEERKEIWNKEYAQRERERQQMLRKIDNELAAVEFRYNIIDREFGQTREEKQVKDQETLARDLRWENFTPEPLGGVRDQLDLGFRE